MIQARANDKSIKVRSGIIVSYHTLSKDTFEMD
jgi:hypothetical protein